MTMRSEVVKMIWHALHNSGSKDDQDELVSDDSLLWRSSTKKQYDFYERPGINVKNFDKLSYKREREYGDTSCEIFTKFMKVESTKMDYTYRKEGILKLNTMPDLNSSTAAAQLLLSLATENVNWSAIKTSNAFPSNFLDHVTIARHIATNVVGLVFQGSLFQSVFVASLLKHMNSAPQVKRVWRPSPHNSNADYDDDDLLSFFSIESIFNKAVESEPHTNQTNNVHTELKMVRTCEIQMISTMDTMVKNVYSVINSQRRPLLVEVHNKLGVMFPAELFDPLKFPTTVLYILLFLIGCDAYEFFISGYLFILNG